MDSSIFYTDSQTNGFDNLAVNVAEIFKNHPVESLRMPSKRPHGDRLRGLYRSSLLPLKHRLRIWDQAFLSNLDLGWFDDFNDYWTTVLGGRPLWSPQDLYFLKNVYRVKFQHNILPDTQKAEVHLEAWQRPELLYFLLHLLTKRTSTHDIAIYQQALKLRGKQTGLAILEYGCGLAPFTYNAIKFLKGSKKNDFYPTDLAMLPFHYGAWRLQGNENVHPHLLKPENNFQSTLQTKMDLIFCVQVFEHMNEPLHTVKYFHDTLHSGGVLVFDFILTDAKGLDSKQGTEQRGSVLEFVREHFDISFPAELSPNRSLPLTYAVKK
jgi:SAM-dependent methyltransferase